ncbi:MAG: aspartyl protease family protein [Burkholderiales bacterium]
MPSLNLQITQLGPCIQAFVTITTQRSAALQKAGQPIPAPQQGTFLVDTGASGTCIDPSLLSALQLTPKSYTPIQTPSTNGTPIMCPVYDIQLIVVPTLRQSPTPQISFAPHVRSVSVIGAALSHQGISGLIGRDILEQCLMIYNGQAGNFTLSW